MAIDTTAVAFCASGACWSLLGTFDFGAEAEVARGAILDGCHHNKPRVTCRLKLALISYCSICQEAFSKKTYLSHLDGAIERHNLSPVSLLYMGTRFMSALIDNLT